MKTNNPSIIHTFFEAIINIFIFLPYFFSVSALIKTFFTPWKNIKTKNTSKKFSIQDSLNAISFNLISIAMGVIMRSSILFFYLIVQGIYMITLPFIIILFFIMYPVIKMFSTIQKTEDQRKADAKEYFVNAHLMDEVNRPIVENWFEGQYVEQHEKKQWWKLKNLFTTPPLARDWAVGYTPTLDEYAEDLTDTSYQLSIRHHIIGRDKEVAIIERVLSQSSEANVLLVGESGVGKHTIVDALSKKVYEGKSTTLLSYKRILLLNMERVLTEFSEQKKREEFFEQLIQEAVFAKNVILLINNFDRYISSDEDRVDLTIPIEKYAKTSGVQIIGITTPFLYEKYIFQNGELRNIFTKVDVQEISKDIALSIMLEKAIEFEVRYKITIPFEILKIIIDKSEYYINSIPFPEKALQLLDAACVYTVQTLKQNVVQITTVDSVLTQKTNVPSTLDDVIKNKLLHLEDLLKTKILGQDEAVKEVASTLRISFLLLGKRKKPLASFLFLGPTGVGKTETAKVISNVFFGNDRDIVRFDMSLFQAKEDISKLIGSIQNLSPGLLTNAIRENPYGVFLIDEIEKANHDLLNIFLTIFDEGYFMDGFGQVVDCKNLIIVATSNAGADHIYQVLLKQTMQHIDQTASLGSNELTNYLVEHRIFSPEFLNRFDGIIAYKPIQQDTAIQIARGIINGISNDVLQMYGVKISVSDTTLTQFASQGFNTQYGVRNLERTLRQKIEDTIAKQILEGHSKAGDTVSF